MKQSKEYSPKKTPVKKWQDLSDCDELAIIESSPEKQQSNELFISLVGHTPDFKQQLQKEQKEDDNEQSSFPSEQASSFDQESHQTYPLNAVSNFQALQYPTSSKENQPPNISKSTKGCKCKNSQCLKNYCECYRDGLTCSGDSCSCTGCENKQITPSLKENYLKARVKQNSSIKVCKCKNSKCQKKYCECHSAGRKCSSLCECIDCQNQEKGFSFDKMRKMRKIEVNKENLPTFLNRM